MGAEIYPHPILATRAEIRDRIGKRQETDRKRMIILSLIPTIFLSYFSPFSIFFISFLSVFYPFYILFLSVCYTFSTILLLFLGFQLQRPCSDLLLLLPGPVCDEALLLLLLLQAAATQKAGRVNFFPLYLSPSSFAYIFKLQGSNKQYEYYHICKPINSEKILPY